MSAFHEVAIEHVRRLNRLIDRGGVDRIRKLYDQAQANLERRIASAIGSRSAPFTVYQYRSLLAQVRHGQMEIARRMGMASAEATSETQREALRGLIRQIKRVEAREGAIAPTLPIEEAARFAGVIDKRKTSLLAQNRSSMAKYGASVVRAIEGNLAQSLVQGDSTGDAIAKVAKTADVEFWRAERIIRTEQAWAVNATSADGIRESARVLGDLFMRWTELVDDNGHPMDDRVSADSVAMHGQVVRPGGMFTMPDSASSIVIVNRYGESRVNSDMLGESWSHPPSRPHDRATIVPWRPGWGAPGWEVIAGRKHLVRAFSRG